MIFKTKNENVQIKYVCKNRKFFFLNCCRNTPCMREFDVWENSPRLKVWERSARAWKIKRWERWKLWKTAGTPLSLTNGVWSLTLDVLQRVWEPVESLVQSLAVGGAGCLDVPVPVPHALQAQLLSQLRWFQSVWKILLSG